MIKIDYNIHYLLDCIIITITNQNEKLQNLQQIWLFFRIEARQIVFHSQNSHTLIPYTNSIEML